MVRDLETGAEVVRRAPQAADVQRWKTGFFLPDGRPVGLAVRAKLDQFGMPKPSPQVVLWDLAADRLLAEIDPGFPVTERLLAPSTGLFAPTGGGRLLVAPAEKDLTGRNPAHPGKLYELPSARLLADVPPFGDPSFSIRQLGPGGNRLLGSELDRSGEAALGATWVVRAMPAGDILLRVPNRATDNDMAGELGPDGRLLAVGADRGQVEVWDVDTKDLLFRWQPHAGKMVHHLAFGPAGEIAAVSLDDDRLIVLRLPEVRQRLAPMGLGW
jgi:hypothetical protein